jgi:hypothetical protein
MYNISWITVIAFLQTCKDWVSLNWNRFRRNYLVALAHSGTRDMVLLRSGQWVDAVSCIPSEEVEWYYYAEKHHLIAVGGERMGRWHWIGATVGDRDLMDFFDGLRLSTSRTLTDDKALALYVCQKGWVPTGQLHVTKRDGTEEEYVIRHGYLSQPHDTHSSNVVDYIR